MSKPKPCTCDAKPWPHRPMSVAGCQHNTDELYAFFDRVFARMEPDSARAIKTAFNGAEQ